jgi:hypothetical protein
MDPCLSGKPLQKCRRSIDLHGQSDAAGLTVDELSNQE